jgi:hypothetical protein
MGSMPEVLALRDAASRLALSAGTPDHSVPALAMMNETYSMEDIPEPLRGAHQGSLADGRWKSPALPFLGRSIVLFHTAANVHDPFREGHATE